MRNGFIFNYELCTGCRACSAACMLENGWSFRSRTIYSSNSECFRPDPVINLSMACNHCGDPVCLRGCPSGAYRKDNFSGAVIIDPGKCLGCRYCIWNCPYDAPKFDNASGIIEKCHLCYHRIEEGIEPACSSSCPTGALSFGKIPETISTNEYSWFPEKNINPSLLLSGRVKFAGPVIIPERFVSISSHLKPEAEKRHGDWSLVGFTFVSILSVALSAAALFMERSFNGSIQIALIIIAALFSLFHLGNRLKAWRAIVNIKSSPLSREIALFLIYATLLIISEVKEFPFSEVIISLTGILLILSIDSVYLFSECRERRFTLHSGQAWLAVMLMISFLLQSIEPFLFVSFIRGVISAGKILSEERKEMFVLRFIRLAFLIITVFVLIMGEGSVTFVVYMIFFSGELADRVIFYVDFRPLNIKDRLM